MEQLGKENAIRLRSQEGAYVVAHDDRVTIEESKDGSSPKAKWVVERVEGNVIRLKSRHGRYLSTTDGKVDWEPIPNGDGVKLKSWGDKLLQADGEPKSQNWTVSLMRWVGELLEGCCEPNSVSHHDPNTQNWVFWDVVEDEPVANNPFSSALKDLRGSELNFTVPPRGPVALPFQRRNVTARGALHRERRGCVVASNALGQTNSGIRLDASDYEEAYDFGQRNSS